ncbi:phenylalanine--tRNA ligase subunit beta [Parasphingopyxis lamellibrachiae]|uniref:Phenylalanine--tRNA ligase beta subunit n=1 Tax=Parasphingopyxis lamellibrachiae TaxID=680125 RepID=A0A3D9FJ51_9SPHN|nr:phenylalanine--tRNA ligase subunit beta [Parasphingopyxis lamellibrachiae]RED17131.1 phenylalanyl-tRNA synthetase beta subunit [Parasphingopyxis lamellibrachiae]
MKFTLGWLKEHLDTEADLDTILETLTAIGLEVEGVENPGAQIGDFRIARVVSAEKHPNADKLQLLKVDTGSGDPVQVVCGAPNARAGMVGVFAAPGMYVPGIDVTLGPAKIRDVESFGMMCSERELELSDAHEGVIDLGDEAAANVGESYAIWAGLDDPVIDIAITPNRQDCMGVYGVARDLAAAGLGTLKPLQVSDITANTPCSIEIRTDDPEGCPAFFGRSVSGVANGPSPAWMQKRLRAIGQKPISALVDITNYIMIDHGRPLHVYDRAKLGKAIFARRAEDGETVVALNGKEYRLDDSMTVIADENSVHDIGGIMGGEHSGVQPETTDIVIECAYFTPERIALTGQRLGLMSDARARFERGVDPAFLDDGLAIATQLVLDICGGEASAKVEAGAPPLETKAVAYDPELCATLGGLSVPFDTQRASLEALGFTVEGPKEKGAPFAVSVPSWRRDIVGAPDLVEEVLRLEGFDAIPSTALPRKEGVATPTASPEQKRERKVRRAAAARGLNEAVTWSFIPEAEAALSGEAPWVLANPISEDMKVMRTSMIPGLAAAAKRNADRGAASIRLFEIGRRYLAEDERPTLGLILAGAKDARHWQGGGAPFDAYDAKAEILALLDAAGAPTANLQLFGDTSPLYHPGRSGRLCLGPKNMLAEFGELHPATLKALDLDGPAMAAELYLDAVPMPRSSGHMRPAFTPPALQAVTRDFAFLLDSDTPAGDLLRTVRSADKQVLVDARIFDVFTGKGVAEGKKSVAIEVTLQPGEKSFTEEELKAISDKVVKAAEKVGGELRG